MLRQETQTEAVPDRLGQMLSAYCPLMILVGIPPFPSIVGYDLYTFLLAYLLTPCLLVESSFSFWPIASPTTAAKYSGTFLPSLKD